MENNNRREFLKKVAYKAPAVLVLGTLMAPASGHANSKVSTNPFSASSSTEDGDSGSNNGGLGSN